MFIFEKPPAKPSKPECVYQANTGVSEDNLQKSIFDYLKKGGFYIIFVMYMIYDYLLKPFISCFAKVCGEFYNNMCDPDSWLEAWWVAQMIEDEEEEERRRRKR